MFFTKRKDHSKYLFKTYIRNKAFQRFLIGLITVVASFVIIQNGAAPQKYKLEVGQKSDYDVIAPRDIENKIKTEENRKAAAAAVAPIMKVISDNTVKVINARNDFFNIVETERKQADNVIQNSKKKKDPNWLKEEKKALLEKLSSELEKLDIILTVEQVNYLLFSANNDEMNDFKEVTKYLVDGVMLEDITKDNLDKKVTKLKDDFQNDELIRRILQDNTKVLSKRLKDVAGILVQSILKPNRDIDTVLTDSEKEKASDRKENEVKVRKNERIISKYDLVTQDKYEMLKELNLLETSHKLDIPFALSIMIVILILALVLILYMGNFCKDIFYNRDDIILLCVIILLTILVSNAVYKYFSPLGIPIFTATMLISILLDLRLALVVNVILTIAISLIVKGDLGFFYIAMISGPISAYLVSKAKQRSKLSIVGVVIAVLNVIIVLCMGIIFKSDFKAIFEESRIVFLNGIISMILTIGILPFLESAFNVITPLKLVELTNPDKPLMRRLLMEAPGTYHHSLMVGNLAEVATEAIDGNALLARVASYFHDIGKLKRPSFFKENQLSENPHDRMTANLSTLVITSHTHDGDEIAQKYKIPSAIRDIIKQHHGTTLVAFFYHKAKKGDKLDEVKQEHFRYEGPRPTTKEAAVVMLADSVEAAVRSMVEKTEGKIEGLVRKIIKDKLDDGQLDLCDITLKDLDIIAKSFMRVLSGYYHAREEYPEIKVQEPETLEEKIVNTNGGNQHLEAQSE